MKQKYIIQLELCDRNRSFGEILNSIINFILKRDEIEKATIYEKKEDFQ